MKQALLLARFFSSIFRPSYYPTVGTLILLSFTYLAIFPWFFKIWVLALIHFFTVILPSMGIYAYRRYHHWSLQELRLHRRRYVPYIINIVCYMCLMHIMTVIHMPHFLVAIIGISLIIQMGCLLFNLRWKVSMHSAGSGGIIGALVAYSVLFAFNPIWWLSAAFILSGCVMTSRMLLRQHTLGQVMAGTLIGIVGGIMGVWLM